MTRGTKITELCCCASAHVSSDPDMALAAARPASSAVVQAARSDQLGRSRSGSLAMLAAIRRASSTAGVSPRRLRAAEGAGKAAISLLVAKVVKGDMRMISKLGGAFVDFLAKRRIKNSPELHALHERSESLISDLLAKGIEEEIARIWAKQTFEELVPILSARDKRMECRKQLVGGALWYSDYHVIMIPPSPEPDPTGFRDLKGISGELWDHRLEIARRHDAIRSLLVETSLELTEKNAGDAIVVLGAKSNYYLNMANTLRVCLDDYDHDLDRDWYRPMLFSLAVQAENKIRKMIGLPTTLDEDIAAMSHATMADVILSGAKFPDRFWREHYHRQIDQGSPVLPEGRF